MSFLNLFHATLLILIITSCITCSLTNKGRHSITQTNPRSVFLHPSKLCMCPGWVSRCANFRVSCVTPWQANATQTADGASCFRRGSLHGKSVPEFCGKTLLHAYMYAYYRWSNGGFCSNWLSEARRRLSMAAVRGAPPFPL